MSSDNEGAASGSGGESQNEDTYELALRKSVDEMQPRITVRLSQSMNRVARRNSRTSRRDSLTVPALGMAASHGALERDSLSSSPNGARSPLRRRSSVLLDLQLKAAENVDDIYRVQERSEEDDRSSLLTQQTAKLVCPSTLRLSAMRHSNMTMHTMNINSEMVYTCDEIEEEKLISSANSSPVPESRPDPILEKSTAEVEANAPSTEKPSESPAPTKKHGRARQLGSPTRKVNEALRRPTNHTNISEAEVLQSKYLISFDTCFPNKKNRRCSRIEVDEFKNEIENQMNDSEMMLMSRHTINDAQRSESVFLTEIEEQEREEERDKRYLRQRRENLLREVWEKQYQHNIQSFEEAVIQVADNLADSNDMKMVKKAILLNPVHKGYFVRKASLLRESQNYNGALQSLTHVINKLENSQLEEGQEIQALAMSYTAEWAETFVKDSKYERALTLFTEIINNRYCSESLHLTIQLRVAECLLAMNNREKCLDLLNYLCRRWPQRSDLFLMRARLHGKSLNASAQFHDVKRAIAVGPSNEQALVYYDELETKSQDLYEEALRLTSSKQFWSAHQKVSLAIQIVPDKVEFYLLRGMLKRCVGEFMQAIDDLEMVIDWAVPGAGQGVLHASRVDEAKYQIMLTLNDFACEVARFDLNQALLILNSIIDRQEEQQLIDAKTAAEEIANIPDVPVPSHSSQISNPTTSSQASLVENLNPSLAGSSRSIGQPDTSTSSQLATQTSKSPAALPLHVYANRAGVHTKLEHYTLALKDYEYAFQHSEKRSARTKALQVQIALIRSKLGDQCYRNGDYEKAHEEYCHAITWDEKCIVYYIRRSHTRYMQRNLDLAKADLKYATTLYEVSAKVSSRGPARHFIKANAQERSAILTEINKLSLVLIGKEYKHKGLMPSSLTNFRIKI